MKLLLKERRPHQRRWWQILVRGIVVSLVVIGLAYVTLPWWLPTSLLRSWIAHDLAGQTGVDVTIDDLSISWREGLVIHYAPPGMTPEDTGSIATLYDVLRFDNGEMVAVGNLSTVLRRGLFAAGPWRARPRT